MVTPRLFQNRSVRQQALVVLQADEALLDDPQRKVLMYSA